MVGLLFGIVPMFVHKDFARRRFVAQICANSGAHAHFGATKRYRTTSSGTNIGTITNNKPTHFEPKRLKPKLDNVKRPVNRVPGH